MLGSVKNAERLPTPHQTADTRQATTTNIIEKSPKLASLNNLAPEDQHEMARAVFLAHVCHVCKQREILCNKENIDDNTTAEVDNNEEHDKYVNEQMTKLTQTEIRKGSLEENTVNDIGTEDRTSEVRQRSELLSIAQGRSQSLRACTGCRLIYYCGRQHQRLHWPLHRQLCRAAGTLLSRLKLQHPCQPLQPLETPAQWRQLQLARLHLCEQAMSRPVRPDEREMFLFPRSCRVCHATGGSLSTCPRCRAVYWCREQHRDPEHERWCDRLREFERLVEHQNKFGWCDPSVELAVSYPPQWDASCILINLMKGADLEKTSELEKFALSEKSSYPLSALWALQASWGGERVRQKETLVVHVVGAEAEAECFDLFSWETLLLHMLPRLKRVRICFIGKDLRLGNSTTNNTQHSEHSTTVDLTCDDCQKAGRKAECRLVPGTAYHNFISDSAHQEPRADIVCAFNAALYGRPASNEDDETKYHWRPSLASLVQGSAPLLVTAYTKHEIKKDLHQLQKTCGDLKVVIDPQYNAFSSLRPARNFIDEENAPLVFKNQYLICVRAEQTPSITNLL